MALLGAAGRSVRPAVSASKAKEKRLSGNPLVLEAVPLPHFLQDPVEEHGKAHLLESETQRPESSVAGFPKERTIHGPFTRSSRFFFFFFFFFCACLLVEIKMSFWRAFLHFQDMVNGF